MRPSLPTLLLLAFASVPLQGQTCKKVPPPFLPSLLPERVASMPLEFTSDPSGGCRSMYRPASAAARATSPWAVVTLDANAEGSLGETAEEIRATFTGPTDSVLTMSDWAIVFRPVPMGDEFIAFIGSVKITVLVKNGDQGPVSEALAARFFEAILPKVPCG